jgi:hypothetical protein
MSTQALPDGHTSVGWELCYSICVGYDKESVLTFIAARSPVLGEIGACTPTIEARASGCRYSARPMPSAVAVLSAGCAMHEQARGRQRKEQTHTQRWRDHVCLLRSEPC